MKTNGGCKGRLLEASHFKPMPKRRLSVYSLLGAKSLLQGLGRIHPCARKLGKKMQWEPLIPIDTVLRNQCVRVRVFQPVGAQSISAC